MGKSLGYHAPYREWIKVRREIRAEIMEKGYNSNVNAFTQYYGSDDVDGSILRMPLTGFIKASDPKFLSTLEKVEKDLKNKDGIFIRYKNDDGITGKDNGFILLSFWYVEDLILIGRIKDAKETFENLLSYSNHLMLFSEELDFDNSNEMLGNFPQAITHLGVIRAAVKLNRAMRKKGVKLNK